MWNGILVFYFPFSRLPTFSAIVAPLKEELIILGEYGR